jgi:membrane-associated phospholipid phosphatase
MPATSNPSGKLVNVKVSPRSYAGSLLRLSLCLCLMALMTGVARAGDDKGPPPAPMPSADAPQPPAPVAPARDDRPSRFERRLFSNLLEDQKAIWTSPRQFRAKDLRWFAPLGTITGLSFAYDPQISKRFVNKGTHVKTFQSFSTAGALTFVGLGAGAYLWGVRTGDDRMRETGVLSAEAVADAMAFGTVLKYSSQRQRPGIGNGQGDFFATTSSPSLPSDHALIAWSAASVIAHEYPGWATKLGVYGLASAVSIARVAGDKHFASDVLVGSAAGWLIGRHVYKAHHEREMDVLDYGTFDSHPRKGSSAGGGDPQFHRGEQGMLPYARGSTYVPLDSWIYPALRRLAALGLIPSQFAGMAPWTRADCLRQTEEAESNLNIAESVSVEPLQNAGEAAHLIASLKKEFAEDEAGSFQDHYRSLSLESVYTRYTAIMGPPLRDSFDFGQTIVNDFGRPYGRGGNLITGFSARGQAGRFAFYFRGEYQHAAQAPPIPDGARNFIHTFDKAPLPPAVQFPETDRARINEAYLAGYFGNVDFTVGKQALWWGPSVGFGPWLYSNNAEPIYMLRFNNRRPLHLGPMQIRAEFFFGKASGRLKPARPLLQGQKVTLKVTRDLELGFSRTITFGGAGRQPLTLGSFWLSFSSLGDNPLADLPGHDPGDRRGGFDWSYRLPGLRKYGATFYGDSFTDDDPSPLGGGAPPRAAWTGGLYFAQLPRLQKFDLRLEGSTSDVVTTVPGRFVYYNTVYLDGYTNNKNLIGNWLGRQGVGFNASTTYWISPESRVQFGYRRAKQDSRFLPGGGTQDDISVQSELRVRREIAVSGLVQYERWLLPLLSVQRQSNWTTAIQVSIFPKNPLWRSRRVSHVRP